MKIKVYVVVFLMLILPCYAIAAVPNTINYQGRVTDSVGVPLQGSHSINFSLYSAATGGPALWSGTQVLTVTDGLFSAELGSGTPFGALAFDVPYFLGLSINGGAELTPRQPFSTIPYAMMSRSVEAGSVTASEIAPATILFGNIAQNACTDGQIMKWNNAGAAWQCAVENNHSGTVQNTMVGQGALQANTTGASNTASGYWGLKSNTTGDGNTANGDSALYLNTSGSLNTAVGEQALGNNSTGNANTAVGRWASSFNTSGTNNTAVGAGAGRNNQLGTGNVYLGFEAGFSELGSNKLHIANNRTSSLISGDFNVGTVSVNGALTATSFTGDGSALTGINVDDADADPANEIQALSLTGTTVALSNGGGSVDIATANDGRYVLKAGDSMTGNLIVNGNVTASNFIGDIVGSGFGLTSLPSNSVTSVEIVNGSITQADIALGNITGGHIANNSIESADIFDGTITNADIAPGASIAQSKIANLGQVASLNIITGADIQGGSITGLVMANDSISSHNIVNGTVTSLDIADGTITSLDIADGPGSNLNADLLDGIDSSTFETVANSQATYLQKAGDSMTGSLIATAPVLGLKGIVSDTTGATFGVWGRSHSSTGTGVKGWASSPTGVNYGVWAKSASNEGTAVYALTSSQTGPTYGVWAKSASSAGTGVYGWAPAGTGVYGRSDDATFGIGVLGAAAHVGNSGSYGVKSLGNAYVSGSLTVTGSISKGSGTFIQPHKKDATKEIHYAFFEGPEHAVFLRGTAKLQAGEAVIKLPEHFSVVAAEKGIQVQVTPYSANTQGLAVVERSRNRIVVRELANGEGSFEFGYFITGVRDGFQEFKPVIANRDFKPAAHESLAEFEQRFSGSDITTQAIRGMLMENGLLSKAGKLNMKMMDKLGWSVSDQSIKQDRHKLAAVQ